MQSFGYKDITWEHKHDRPILDIKLKDSPKGGMSIVTRQVCMLWKPRKLKT